MARTPLSATDKAFSRTVVDVGFISLLNTTNERLFPTNPKTANIGYDIHKMVSNSVILG
jgi:hypothetical protein